jgi:hypothetical protein
MRYTVVTISDEKLKTIKFENKRELKKWMKEVDIDVNKNDVRAGDCIHACTQITMEPSTASRDECIIFRCDPMHLEVERTVRI